MQHSYSGTGLGLNPWQQMVSGCVPSIVVFRGDRRFLLRPVEITMSMILGGEEFAKGRSLESSRDRCVQPRQGVSDSRGSFARIGLENDGRSPRRVLGVTGTSQLCSR